jgi:hypothetical protein
MKEELSIFFQICRNPVLLNKYKDVKLIKDYCKIVVDDFVTFPNYDIEDLKYRGFPNDEYLENRRKEFPEVLNKIQKSSKEEQIKIIREFLESCHGDDTTRDDKNNVHEPEYMFYHCLFTKSKKIPFDRIFKAYPELRKEEVPIEFPAIAYKIPVGTIIDIEFKDGSLRFNDVQDSDIQLDFLRLPFRKAFTAKIVVSPKWFKYDLNYYRNRNAKWQELRIKGIKTKDIKVYILDCSRKKEWLKETLENVGIKSIVLNPVEVNSTKDIKEALIDCYKKEYRAILINNDIYVAKKTTAKVFKLDGQIPSNSFPWDLIHFNIHYSQIPETLLNE